MFPFLRGITVTKERTSHLYQLSLLHIEGVHLQRKSQQYVKKLYDTDSKAVIDGITMLMNSNCSSVAFLPYLW